VTSTAVSGFPVVGVVGGGQLARMMQPAAITLGVRLRVLAVRPDDSAAQVIPDVEIGDHRDLAALRRFARGCDVVTFDHEHVPPEHLSTLHDAGVVLRPGPGALRHAQDKIVMRRRLTELGLPCPRWRVVQDADQIGDFAATLGTDEVVLKAPRGGYDGRGVWRVRPGDSLPAPGPLLAEEAVAFIRELAVVVARSPHGQAAAYPVVRSIQADGICREVIAPAPSLLPDHAISAQEIGLRIAGELDVVGMLAVEMFDTPTGVLVNELAMRPHNSGHWTIEGARTSQFEQHLRAVLDLPLGDTRTVAPYAVMVNVLGGTEEQDLYGGYVHCMARDPALHIHAYGKEVRPGRKIGHVTTLGSNLETTLERARHAAAYLGGDDA
jgi:5-(carboxyamino)imidazole ribonucleotide synthase